MKKKKTNLKQDRRKQHVKSYINTSEMRCATMGASFGKSLDPGTKDGFVTILEKERNLTANFGGDSNLSLLHKGGDYDLNKNAPDSSAEENVTC